MASTGPLDTLDQWDDHVRSRYQEGREQSQFRVFDENSPQVVKDFYLLNHRHQTHAFAKAKQAEYSALNKGERGIWEMMEFLNTVVDDSDPDTDLSQIEHNLQTAEAIRADGHPRWMQLTGLIHDLGKVLVTYGEPQWAVVGDTFPTGCAWDKSIVFHQYFSWNPDAAIPEYQTECGVYEPHCGLDKVVLSFGHDEYLYHVVKPYLPDEALAMIRYHSCYPIHREGAYTHLMNERDHELMAWVRKFNPYDLYSKGHAKPSVTELKPYYEELIAEYFPATIRW
ncbi:MAG: inositol oxygenase family protein [Bryobacter sp.]|nr:inositol oxygenase family protein [Bryobacter sp.]